MIVAMTRKTPRWQDADPAHDREQRRYDTPAPSREFILKTLHDHGKPMSRQALLRHFDIREPEVEEGLQVRVAAMIRDGQLVENRRQALGIAERMDLVAGRVIGHRDGFGFVNPEAGGDDIFLSPRQMRALMHGDRVLVRVVKTDDRGRMEGSVVDVLERKTQELVGRYMHEHGVGFVIPDNTRITQDVVVADADRGDAEHGQIVTVELLEQPTKRTQPIGRIKQVLGNHMAPGMEIDIAVRSHGVPHEWPADVLKAVNGLDEQVPEAAKQGRTDLRQVPLVTIDGADARDFDDAVYAEKTRDGWKLLVAIADVSAYVKPDSALDAEAHNRATSVYFPGSVIPMLPEVLSNGLCSLNPEVDRLCMVCEMRVDEDGHVTRSKFYEAVMKSAARLIYDDVAAALDAPKKAPAKIKPLLPQLQALHSLFEALHGARKQRGAIDFESNETRIVFSDDRKIERVVPVVRNVAHKMIEECMIAANVQAAKKLEKAKIPTLFRVHDTPPTEKLADLRAFLAERGLGVGGGDKPEAHHFAQLIGELDGRDDQRLVQTVLLRSMSQAVYQPENKGHFGLALDSYGHFTSPIRRYPDLLVHRGLKHLLCQQPVSKFAYSLPQMEQLGAHCSANERRADEATRDVVDWLKCEFMRERVGEQFSGLIVSVTSFGLFVELDDIAVTGLVHVSHLSNDYYHFESKYHRLRGERSGQVFRLADRMQVKVVRVDLDERKIDFEPVGAGRKSKRR